MTVSKKIILSFVLMFLGLIGSDGMVSSVFAATPSLTFDPPLVYLAKGENGQINIVIDTDGIAVAGAGAILHYDPTYISIVNIAPGTIFADYPTATFDNTTGIAKLSGIVSSPNNLYSGKGAFGEITLQGKSEGSSLITFEYEKDSTTDSNIAVTYGTGDVLAKVGELNIIVTPNSITPEATPPTTSNDVSAELPPAEQEKKTFKEKVLEFLGIAPQKEEIDPYAPLVSQAPNRNPSSQQPTTVAQVKQGVLWPAIALFLGTVVLIVLIVLFIKHKNKPHHIVKNI